MEIVIIALLMLSVVIVKALADTNEEKYKRSKKSLNGSLYHLFYVVLIFVSMITGAFINEYVAMFTMYFSFHKFLLSIVSFALIYFACFDWIYNLLMSNDMSYIGKVSWVDRFVVSLLLKLPEPIGGIIYEALKVTSFISSLFVINHYVR